VWVDQHAVVCAIYVAHLVTKPSMLAGFELYVGRGALHHGPDEFPAIFIDGRVMKKIIEKHLTN